MSVPGRKHMEKDGFRLRGVEVSRIDAFSDVVFGFALTLLVVSLEVPKTYEELYTLLRGFVPFAISFCLLMTVWYSHYKFFRRFGLHDVGTIWINSILLFVVLFYVYPLKFLFRMALTPMLGGGAGAPEEHHVAGLLVVYGVGFAAIYFLIAALYWNGWRQRNHLELNELEDLLTRGYIVEAIGRGAVGLLSALVAELLPPAYAGWAGLVYLLISPMLRLSGLPLRRRIEAMRRQLVTESETPESLEST